jgi:two-component system response regulator PilR (NtrC family)
MTINALIIDDEPDIRELLEITLMRMGLDTYSAGSVQEAKDRLSERTYQLCFTDMNLPDGNGIDLVAYIQSQFPDTPVAMITAYGSIETAIQALKAGAFDFISKPLELSHLREVVTSALKLSSPDTKDTASTSSENLLLGQSPQMEQLRKKVRKLARSQAPIYISGESGSGKELVARMIHLQGPRADQPFIAVNCGAIPSELVESEFFGHKKGSFSGAISDKEGLFSAANGGTLFLDEVADLPLPMQVKLLRAIQEKSIRPVGDHHEEALDVRILSATHKNIDELVEQNKFRQDLYYRINVIQLNVPPLRDRKEDIALLAKHILKKIGSDFDEDPRLTPDAIRYLQAYPFPGNVRELENILERAYTLCDSDEITAKDLQLKPVALAPAQAPSTLSQDNESAPTTPIRDTTVSLEDFLEKIERKAIEDALEQTRWNKTKAAEKLGITFRALRYRLKKLGMD